MSHEHRRNFAEVQIFSGGIIVNKDDKIFLAKGQKFGNKYIFPGGKVEANESIEEAAIREIREETGMQVEIESQLHFSEFRDRPEAAYKNKRFVLCDLVLRYSGDESEIELNDEYDGDHGWFSVGEALALDLGGNVRETVLAYREYVERKSSMDNWKRAVAEFENYKKSKMNLERDMAGRAVEDFAYRLLPVVDNFHASTDHIPDDQKESGWVQGIMYIQKQLEQVLQEMGIEEIVTKEGDTFDPRVHEAVAETNKDQKVAGDEEEKDEDEDDEQQEIADKEKNNAEKIKQVLVKGYKRGERVVRAARVIVV